MNTRWCNVALFHTSQGLLRYCRWLLTDINVTITSLPKDRPADALVALVGPLLDQLPALDKYAGGTVMTYIVNGRLLYIDTLPESYFNVHLSTSTV